MKNKPKSNGINRFSELSKTRRAENKISDGTIIFSKKHGCEKSCRGEKSYGCKKNTGCRENIKTTEKKLNE
jgi:hypothetical protein